MDKSDTFWLFITLYVLGSFPEQTKSAKTDVPLNLRTHHIDGIPSPNYSYQVINAADDDDYDEEPFEKPNYDTGLRKMVSHPCQRKCVPGEVMTCRYTFTLEYYSTMSKACFQCPFNLTDCNLKDCVAANGVKRTILAVNRQVPGPGIDVCYGDTVEVEVNNLMYDISTTIHWHGLFQKETPFMDGVPFVSQCLIPPQGTFLYRFFADNPGTHLWHSHSAVQRGDGLYGPLIIRVPKEEDPNAELYDEDLSEHVMVVLDWVHTLAADKFAHHIHSGGDNKPPSLLVNGKGRFRQFQQDDKIIYTPAEKFTVRQGQRYKFRLINAGFLNCPIEVSVDNHNITVIGTEGGYLSPTEGDSLISAAGERFDFIIDANQEIGNYWIKFKGLLDCGVKKAFQVAILHYEGADEEEDPESDVTYETASNPGVTINALNTQSGEENKILMSEIPSVGESEEDPSLREEPDIKVYIPYDFYRVDNIHYQYPERYGYYQTYKKARTTTPQFNHISMQFPNFPVMADLDRASQIEYCNGSSISMSCRYEFCECPHILQIPLNAVVEMILIDEGAIYDASHPMHLHGYTFRLIGMDRLGSSTTEEEVRRLDSEGKLSRNLKNPPLKDTITPPDGGYSIIRLHATNPGFWILHCHIDFHMEMGMALLLRVGEHSDFKLPPENLPRCGNGFLPKPVNETHTAKFFPTNTFINEGTKPNYMAPQHPSHSSLLSSNFLSLLLLLIFVLATP